MSNRIKIVGALAYGIMFLVTFGRVSADWSHSTCYEGTAIEQPCNVGTAALAGFTAGVLWPFYWSWELQESKP